MAWLGGLYGSKNVTEALQGSVRVRRLQESCLHASTGKAQAYSLSTSGFLTGIGI